MSSRIHECPECGDTWHCSGCDTQDEEKICSAECEENKNTYDHMHNALSKYSASRVSAPIDDNEEYHFKNGFMASYKILANELEETKKENNWLHNVGKVRKSYHSLLSDSQDVVHALKRILKKIDGGGTKNIKTDDFINGHKRIEQWEAGLQEHKL